MQRHELYHVDPEILGGTPVFTGTRVPVDSLIDHLKFGDSLDEFLDESGRCLGPTKQSPGRTLSEAQGGEKTSHQEIPFVPAIFQISVPPEQVKYQDLFPALIQVASFSSRRGKLADAA